MTSKTSIDTEERQEQMSVEVFSAENTIQAGISPEYRIPYTKRDMLLSPPLLAILAATILANVSVSLSSCS